VFSATAKFCHACAHPVAAGAGAPSRTPDSYTPKHLAEKILTSKSALEGERKQVTVLFADMKGSMELLADRDPEEARKILDPVLERMMEAVHRYEGTVNQVMGDGIMALFGAPLAHEDHAVRACYAALRMQEAVRRYSDELRRGQGVEVQIRVGVNSGDVVVRSIGSDLRMDYTAVGQTTHLAARMEQLAAPGSIRLAAAASLLAEGFVQVVPLGPVPIKGLGEPIQVYELVGASAARTRLEATARRGLTRFVGRNKELEQLRDALDRTSGGHGQVVAVVGEPGVGKSRLVWELIHSHHVHDCLILRSASVSYGKATAYLPVIELLRGYFGIESRDDPRKIREKVTGKVLTLAPTLGPTVLALLALLDVPVEDASWQALEPLQRRQQTLDAVKRLLLRESEVQPLVVVFEDVHWLDGETQTLLDSLVESLPTKRLLLLILYRPEYQHAWGSKTYYRQLRIDPLPPESVDELLNALLGPDSALGPLKQLLVERTEANPLFLEESLRALVETAALVGERGAYRLTRSVENLEIPVTVQAILAARIDRLAPDDKRLLQTASVIGRDVPVALLQAIAETNEIALEAGLDRLHAAEFLYKVQLFPDAEYTFKHALTQEVAYATLLADRRRALHARLVEAIERLRLGRPDEQVNRLAEHAERSELWDKAVTYARQAGLRAGARGDFRQAAVSFEAALAAAAHLPPSRDTQTLSVDLNLALRVAYLFLGEVDRGLDVAARAFTLAEALGNRELLMIATASLINARNTAGDTAGAAALSERILVLVGAPGPEVRRVGLRTFLAQTYFSLGNYRQVIALLERNREAFGSDAMASIGENDPFVHALVASDCILGMGFAQIGEFSLAATVAEEGARVGMASNAATNRLLALLGLSTPAVARGEYKTAIPWLEEGLAVLRELNFRFFLPSFAALLGYAYARIGRLAEGLALLRDATMQAETSNRYWRARNFGLHSEALLLAGQPSEAGAVAQRGLEYARARGERGYEASCLRALGEAEEGSDPADADAAGTHLQEAMVLATELGMRPLAAHCHLGLGKLYGRTGKREQARKHLTTATTMYREMGMAYWLQKAETEM
jgi:class 3 adenylate cyclase/tetratricopeptide (TPR) repeat protein